MPHSGKVVVLIGRWLGRSQATPPQHCAPSPNHKASFHTFVCTKTPDAAKTHKGTQVEGVMTRASEGSTERQEKGTAITMQKKKDRERSKSTKNKNAKLPAGSLQMSAVKDQIGVKVFTDEEVKPLLNGYTDVMLPKNVMRMDDESSQEMTHIEATRTFPLLVVSLSPPNLL